jgi:hypothetical protein
MKGLGRPKIALMVGFTPFALPPPQARRNLAIWTDPARDRQGENNCWSRPDLNCRVPSFRALFAILSLPGTQRMLGEHLAALEWLELIRENDYPFRDER